MAILDQIISLVEEKSPRHAKKLAANIAASEAQFFPRAEEFLGRYLRLLGRQDKSLEYGVQSYLEMCQQTLAEQVAFARTGRYSSSSFAEVEQRVYANPKVMDSYMHGLLLSQFLWPSHYMVLKFFHDSVSKICSGLTSYLEIGPGHGLYLSGAVEMLPDNANIVALDISKTSMDMTRQLLDNSRIQYICANFLTHEFEQSFDLIVMGEVLEHVEEPKVLLNRLVECLKPGGHAFITAPANAPAIDHIYHFRDVGDIRTHLQGAGLTVLDESYCCTENVSMAVAEAKKLPVMYAAFLHKPL